MELDILNVLNATAFFTVKWLILLCKFHLNKLLEKEKVNGSPFSAQIRSSGYPQHIPELKTGNYTFAFKSHYYGHENKNL